MYYIFICIYIFSGICIIYILYNYILLYILYKILFIIGYYSILNIVPCAYTVGPCYLSVFI